MTSYLDRYQKSADENQENSRIWAELTFLGADIRAEPLFSDAKAVARGTMLRAKQNIATLIDRLNSLGYQFEDPGSVWVPPDQASIDELDALEHQYGELPLSLRMWYEIVGSVNFMGSHPALCRYVPLDSSDLSMLPVCADPLVMDPPILDSFLLDQIPNEFILAPDAAHKSDYSGDGPILILFPNPAMDAPLISAEWDGMMFVNYLRTCFQWGGFPGWRFHPEYPKKELDFLREGLLSL